jgi:autotransporter-associated beta strand protein
MHIARHRRGCARYFHAQILTFTAAALVALPALAAGPGGPVGPVVAPPKAPSTPSAPAVVAPTVPVIPQVPVVTPNIPSATTGPGAPTATTKSTGATDDAKSGQDGNGTPNAFTATVTPTTTGGGVPSGIFDQANAGTLTSYLRIPDTELTPDTFRSNRPLLDVAIVVKKHSGGNSLRVKTDGKGNTSIGKLLRGESYDIQISGKDLEPALDRIGSGKTGTFLVALLLPAVQQAREADRSIPVSSTQRAFARGSKDQTIHLLLAIAKDGTATINWGDGRAPIPVGLVKTGAGALTLSASNAYVGPTTVASGDLTSSASKATNTYTGSTIVNGGVLNRSLPTKGNPGSGGAPGIFDQANAGTLTSYLRIPDTPSTANRQESNAPIPGVGVVARKKPPGASLHVTTDGKGNASLGKLARGESYDIVISGKDLEPALDRIAGGKTNGGTAQPQKIIGVLVALLLPAVQKIETIPSESSSRVFARGSKDQAIHLTLAVAKDGMMTADWGDGSGKQSIGEYSGSTTVNMGIGVIYSGDGNF